MALLSLKKLKKINTQNAFSWLGALGLAAYLTVKPGAFLSGLTLGLASNPVFLALGAYAATAASVVTGLVVFALGYFALKGSFYTYNRCNCRKKEAAKDAENGQGKGQDKVEDIALDQGAKTAKALGAVKADSTSQVASLEDQPHTTVLQKPQPAPGTPPLYPETPTLTNPS